SDEMAEFALQMLPRKEEWPKLQNAVANYAARKGGELNERRFRDNPNDPEAAAEVAKNLFSQHKFDESERLLRHALAIRPDSADAHYSLGVLLMEKSLLEQAEREFLEAIRLQPGNYKARNNVG